MTMTLPGLFLSLVTLIFLSGWGSFCIQSLKERQTRAARISGLFTLVTLMLGILFVLLPITIQWVAAGLILATALGAILLFWLPTGKAVTTSPNPQERIDERTIMFARSRLQPGTSEYQSYYHQHPEHQAIDDAFRQNPGLLEDGSAFYNPLQAASPQGAFFLTETLQEAVDGPVTEHKVVLPPDRMTDTIKHMAYFHGAQDVGVCKLQPYHIYTNIGRGTGKYGAPITLNHRFAVAFTVEMAHEMVAAGPRMPTVMESARQYAEATKIAVILAAAIRNLGYPARAHIDGNYRVIAPLVARDAGMGEIGRMGLLMTPRLGPRVRLAVVTTNLPLVTDTPTRDATVIDFCSICNKCVAACPAQAIPFGERKHCEDGTLRWKIDPERCYTYWTRIGTDCGRCIAVCPYAHPDTFLHNLIRWGVKHSSSFRRTASWLDDVFYGKKPAPHPPPDWMSPFEQRRG